MQRFASRAMLLLRCAWRACQLLIESYMKALQIEKDHEQLDSQRAA